MYASTMPQQKFGRAMFLAEESRMVICIEIPMPRVSLKFMQVGLVKVFKSGAVRIKMGCCEYVVRPGVEQHCRREVFVINIRTEDIVMVAANCRHAVAALDIDSMIKEGISGKSGA
jgi:hypothetical protein